MSLAGSFEARDAFVASSMEVGVQEGYRKLDILLTDDGSSHNLVPQMRTMGEVVVDFITSLDGYASAEGWPGWWGLESPEYLAGLDERPEATLLISGDSRPASTPLAVDRVGSSSATTLVRQPSGMRRGQGSCGREGCRGALR